MAVLHPPASTTRWTLVVLNYQLFVDDSGTHAGAPYQGVAGYLSTADRWSSFNVEWRDALPDDLRGGRFRFAKFVYDVNAGLRDPNQLAPLIDVIKRHVRCGFERMMHMEAYEKIPEKYRAAIGHPYRFCLLLLLQDVAGELRHFAGLPPTERLITIADRQPQQEGRTAAVWSQWVRQLRLRKRVEPIVFRHRRDYPALQAADILAHTSYRGWSRPSVTAVPPGQERRAVLPLSLYRTIQPLLVGHTTPPVPHYTGLVTYERLVGCYPIFDNMITAWRMTNEPEFLELMKSAFKIRYTEREDDED
jgi:hypothetical protein